MPTPSRFHRGRKLDDVDLDAAAPERNRERQTRDSAANDQNPFDAAGHYSGFSFAALTMSRKRS
jgi:hypothetical protein